MSLLLICYVCWQAEKVRLSIWLLIISIAIYLFSLNGAQIYASYNHYEHETYWNPIHYTHYETPSQEMLNKLIAWKERFGNTILYYGQNTEFYRLVWSLLESKEPNMHLDYLDKVLVIMQRMSDHEATQYRLHRQWIILWLQAVRDAAVKQTRDWTSTLHTLYTISNLWNGYIQLLTKRPNEYHIWWYINNRFYSNCERAQCNRVVLPVEQGDTITVYYSLTNMEQWVIAYRH